MSAKISVPMPVLVKTRSGGENWIEPYISGEGTLATPGAPALPQITRLIPIDFGEKIVVRARIIKQETWTDVDVMPFQKPVMRDEPQPETVYLDAQVYSGKALWPRSIFSVSRPVVIHGKRYVALSLYPVRYNPTERKCEYASKIDLKINFINDPADSGEHFDMPRSKVFDDILKPFIFNQKSSQTTGLEEMDGPGAYLIIAAPEFIEAVQPLAAWKKQKGLPVEVYSTNQVGKTPREIKSFLQERYYQADSPVDYLLLFGDSDSLPSFIGNDGGPADHIYTTLDGQDYLPDIIVGRIPVRSIAEAETVVKKIVSYESAPYVQNIDWYRSAMMVSGSDKIDDENAAYCGQLCEQQAGYETVDLFMDSKGTNTLRNAVSSFAQGRSWITYFGHGSATQWKSVDPYFENEHANEIQNIGMLPVITSIACANGAFDHEGDSIAERWLKSGDKQGAAAVFAASRKTPFVYTDSLGRAVAEGYFKEGITAFGAATVFGKLQMFSDFPEPAGGTTETVMQHFHLFGDPELQVWSAPPKMPEVTWRPSGFDGRNQWDIEVQLNNKPRANALIHFYDQDGFSVVAKTDFSGIATLTLPAGESPDSYLITVTGRNLHPYYGDSDPPGDRDSSDDKDEEEDDDGWLCG